MVLERIQKEAKENPLNQGILTLAFLLDSDRFCYSAYQQGTIVRGVDDAQSSEDAPTILDRLRLHFTGIYYFLL